MLQVELVLIQQIRIIDQLQDIAFSLEGHPQQVGGESAMARDELYLYE